MSIMFTGGYSPMLYAPSVTSTNASGSMNASGAMDATGSMNASGAVNSTGASGLTDRKYSKEEIQELKDKLKDAEDALDTAQAVIRERQEEINELRNSIKTVRENAENGKISKAKAGELLRELYGKLEEADESLLGWQATLPNYINAYEKARVEYYKAISTS